MAHPVTLAWDENSEFGLGGYNLYYGTGASGVYDAPGSPTDMGNVTQGTVFIDASGTSYFALKAYNTILEESPFSNEVSATYDVSDIGNRSTGIADALGAMASY